MVWDAMACAGGQTDFTSWSHCRIIRPRDGQTAEVFRFRRRDRQNDEQIPLQDGDQLYCGRILD